MKFIFKLLIVSLVCGALQTLGPWWIIAPACFLIGAVAGGQAFPAFMYSFLGVFVLWAVYAYYLDAENSSLLSNRLIQLFQASDGRLLILLTALIGGLVGGFAGLSGCFFRAMFGSPTKRNKDYLIRN